MASIQIFPKEVLLFKNRKLFFLSIFGKEDKVVFAKSELNFSTVLSVLKNLEEISDSIYLEEVIDNNNINSFSYEDNLPVKGSIYSKDKDALNNFKLFNDDIFFSEYTKMKDRDYVISFDDFVTINSGNIDKYGNINVDSNNIFSFDDSVLYNKLKVDNYEFNFDDFNNFTLLENIYEFKLSIDDQLVEDITSSIVNNMIPKDMLLDHINVEHVKLLVYKDGYLLKTYVFRNTDSLLLSISNFENTISTFDIKFTSNYKALKINNICHNNNIFNISYISFCDFNYYNMNKLDYKVLYNNNCKITPYIYPNSNNSSCIIRVYFEEIVNVKNIELLFKNHKNNNGITLKYRKNIYEKFINKMEFIDDFFGYCKVLDILINFIDYNNNIELQDIYFELCNKNVKNKYETGYLDIKDSNLIVIDSLNLFHKTNGVRDIINQYGNYIGYIDGYSDINMINIEDGDYKSNIFTNSDNATIEFRLKRNLVNYGKIYCDYYSQYYPDNSLISLSNFSFLGKQNNFPKYFVYGLNGYTYSHYSSSYTTDSGGKIINYYEMWRYNENNYFSFIYNITNEVCYLEIIENGAIKTIDESNVYFIDNNNKNGFYYYYLGERFYFNRKTSLIPSIDIYYRNISSSEFIKYNNNSTIDGTNDVDIRINIQNGNKEKYIIRSICFKSTQARADDISINLNDYLDINKFNLNPNNALDNEINDFFYNITCEVKSKYSSDYNSTLNNATACFFNKSNDLYINYNKSNLNATWSKNNKVQYIVLFDDFTESYYRTYLTPFFDINNYKYPDKIVSGTNLKECSIFYNYNSVGNIINEFIFDKVEIITNINFINNSSNEKRIKADYFYSYSIDGDNWSNFIHINYFKCFNAKFIKVITILNDVNNLDSECVISYLNSDKYILLNDNSFDSVMHKKIVSGNKYIFRLIKYYNKNFSFGKIKILQSIESQILEKITELYIDDTLYVDSSIRVSSSDNIVKLSWINNNIADKYNIKIYIDGNLYENIITKVIGEDNLYSYYLIFDSNFKSKDISYTVSYIFDNNSSEESKHAYFYINNKPTIPQKLGIL